MDSNVRLMNEVLGRVARDGVEQSELDQIINKTVAGCIMQSERPSNRLFGLGSRWLCCGDRLSLDELLDAYRGVTIESVAEAARTYLGQSATEVVASSAEPQSNLVG